MRRDEILSVLGEHRKELEQHGVKSLALFGSAAWDEARVDSDVDILECIAKIQRYTEGITSKAFAADRLAPINW